MLTLLCSRAVALPLAPPPRFLHRLPHPRASSSSSSLPPPPPSGMETSYKFGPYKIDAREVFHATPLSYAMVNLRPLLPGHILLFQLSWYYTFSEAIFWALWQILPLTCHVLPLSLWPTNQ
ncbi:hypothetical protein PVAP13_3KG207960 [Panicum virgatum]|uniref:Bis(5'-adenosyl)-triphosphatase n=1 Tax=Panicum virgatum TaxID=38727 RepID=A0A8T0US01_PANVG|nr:hypothetical protein PVAP13_3KG207960 [Panicum virgatum]